MSINPESFKCGPGRNPEVIAKEIWSHLDPQSRLIGEVERSVRSDLNACEGGRNLLSAIQKMSHGADYSSLTTVEQQSLRGSLTTIQQNIGENEFTVAMAKEKINPNHWSTRLDMLSDAMKNGKGVNDPNFIDDRKSDLSASMVACKQQNKSLTNSVTPLLKELAESLRIPLDEPGSGLKL